MGQGTQTVNVGNWILAMRKCDQTTAWVRKTVTTEVTVGPKGTAQQNRTVRYTVVERGWEGANIRTLSEKQAAEAYQTVRTRRGEVRRAEWLEADHLDRIAQEAA